MMHDIRNRLGVIVNSTHLLVRGQDSTRPRVLELPDAATQQVRSLLDDLEPRRRLALRARRGEAKLSVQEIDAAELANAAAFTMGGFRCQAGRAPRRAGAPAV